MASTEIESGQSVLQLLEAGEHVRLHAEGTDASLIVTDRRVVVVRNRRLVLAVPFDGLRLVQFDVERSRPASLVLVPDRLADEPQVLMIPPHQYPAVGEAVALIAQRISTLAAIPN